MKTHRAVESNSVDVIKQDETATKCCGCRMQTGIKFIVFSEFCLTALLMGVTALVAMDSGECKLFLVLCSLISILSTIHGIVSICKPNVKISRMFTAMYAAVTVDWFNFVILIWSRLSYKSYDDDQDADAMFAWILALCLALYGAARIYFSLKIHKHHKQRFASNPNGESSYGITGQIRVIIAFELLLSFIILTMAASLQMEETNTYKRIILIQTCYWCFGIVFTSFICGLLTILKRFSTNNTIGFVFFIMYFVATVQWINYTITFMVFSSDDVFPEMNRRINIPLTYDEYPARRRLLMYGDPLEQTQQQWGDAAEYDYDTEEPSWTPEKTFSTLLTITTMIYAVARVYFTTRVYKYAV
eukprot:249654_1